MGFVLNIFFLPLNHPLYSGFFTALNIPDFQSLQYWKSFEVTALPAQGASPVQGEFSVTDVSREVQPVVPKDLKFTHKHVMKTVSETKQEVKKPPVPEKQEVKKPPVPEQSASPKSTNTLKRRLTGKNKSKEAESPRKQLPLPPPAPACAVALNTHGALPNRIFTGGMDFSISHTSSDRRQSTVITHTENQEGSGYSTSVESGLIVDGTTRLLEDLESRGFLSPHGEFNWTEGFNLQNALTRISKGWHDSMYDNLLGIDCRWSIHAVIGKNAGASHQVLLGFVFHQQHTGEAFFVQIFTTQTAPQPQVTPVPAIPHNPLNVAAVSPVFHVPEPDTDQHAPELETLVPPPATLDPLADDPTFQEDDPGIDNTGHHPTLHAGRRPRGQRTPTPGSHPGSFTPGGIPIPVGNHPPSEGYFSGLVSTPSPSYFTVQGNTPDRPDYYNVQVQQPPPPALPQEPEIPTPLDLHEIPQRIHQQLISDFKDNVRAPYESRRRTYEQALRDYPSQLDAYRGTLSNNERRSLIERWSKAFRAALLDQIKSVSCRDESGASQMKPNRTDFDPDGGSGGGFFGGKAFILNTHIRLSQ
ncbi:hypothetical protein [Endozoicomonas numazuensis]|uniref:Uncharacterized protein n=1 Tax=Endozoicomonas numazuensis TaxID=1137799 RepID=A0A081NFV6_9GAMM|nr:hypothetical protein [Endozoicomonas numazuensis]KEQ17329.1 hypothetical protein GZ78_16085 [Endozoicomonas numazuensis]